MNKFTVSDVAVWDWTPNRFRS